jgi:SnoaL-like domain
MSDVVTTVDAYLEMWNETDPVRRAELIERAWTREGRYVDPLFDAAGHRELHNMVERVHEQFPGHRFRRTSGVDAHHDQVRFTWELAAPDGAVTAAGVDVGAVDDDGRLRNIVGFLGEPAAAIAA